MKFVLLFTPTATSPSSAAAVDGADAGRSLDRGGVDAAVHEAPGLVVLGTEIDVTGDRRGPDRVEHQIPRRA